MGKKRIIKKKGGTANKDMQARSISKLPKKKASSGVVYIQSTYNNTLINVTDKKGDSIMWLTSGSLGFKGAKKGTPFAASKVAGILADKAITIGMKDVEVVIKGIGAGRESAIRSFAAKGIRINLIRDITPIPHNGPKRKKPRRV